MGNAPSTDLPRTESHGRTVEVMETDEKSQGFNELATTNPKPNDDGSSNLNPLQYDTSSARSIHQYTSQEHKRFYINVVTSDDCVGPTVLCCVSVSLL